MSPKYELSSEPILSGSANENPFAAVWIPTSSEVNNFPRVVCRLLRTTSPGCVPFILFYFRHHRFNKVFALTPFALGGVPRAQKMLKGHLTIVISHQVYSYTQTKAPLVCSGASWRCTGASSLLEQLSLYSKVFALTPFAVH